MYRFLHAADLHLDSPLRGLAKHATAPAEVIRGASRKALENLVELAIEEKVAFVLIAGDLFDGDWKDYSTGIFLSHQIGLLGRQGIAVYTVSGNHDAANRITKALDTPQNMTVLSSRKPQSIHLAELKTTIHGQSFATQHVDENLSAGYPAAQADVFNIGLLHTSLDGREGHAVYAPCSVGDLRAQGYQYWALGHVHQQETVSEDPWVVYPGCLQGRHIRETGAKGCALVTVENGAVKSVEMRALDVFRWALCTVDLADAADHADVLTRTRDAISLELKRADGRTLGVRFRFEGATAIASQLAAYPDRFAHQIKALAAEVAGDDLWVEKVEMAATGKRDLESALADDSTLGALLKEIVALPDTAESVDALAGVLADLRKTVPREVFAENTEVDLDNDETLNRLVQEAKQMLLGRLLATGATV